MRIFFFLYLTSSRICQEKDWCRSSGSVVSIWRCSLVPTCVQNRWFLKRIIGTTYFWMYCNCSTLVTFTKTLNGRTTFGQGQSPARLQRSHLLKTAIETVCVWQCLLRKAMNRWWKNSQREPLRWWIFSKILVETRHALHTHWFFLHLPFLMPKTHWESSITLIWLLKRVPQPRKNLPQHIQW